MQVTTKRSATAKHFSPLALAALAALAAVGACRRHEPAPPLPLAAKPEAVSPPAPALAPAATPPDESPPAADGETTDTSIVGKGRWSENRLYKFRLERVAACGALPPGTSHVSAFRGETSWVGALFSLEARGHLFVSPRDLELRRGGVILGAAPGNQPAPAACAPLLPARDLRPGQAVRGFALFEVPKRFRARNVDPIVFSFRPTRWGGARRVDVPIPECFDACAEPSLTAKTAGRSRPTPRQKL